MGAWQCRVHGVRDNRVVRDHLEIVCDSFSDGLGLGQGTLTGSLALSDGYDISDVLAPKRRVVWPVLDGRIYGAFLVAAWAPYGPRDTSVSFTAARADSLLWKRLIEQTIEFQDVDQFDIARALVAYALNLPFGGLPWLRVDQSMSGVRRTFVGDTAFKTGTVADALTKLSQMEDGFDIRLDYSFDYRTGLPLATLRFGHPTLGRTAPVVPLEYPGSVLDWTFSVDTADTENYVRAYGSADTSDPAIDEESLLQEWPLLQGAESSQATDREALNAQARARRDAHQGELNGWSLTVANDLLPMFEIGDVMGPLHIKDRLWPLDKRVNVRASGIKVVPARSGTAGSLSLTVVEAP